MRKLLQICGGAKKVLYDILLPIGIIFLIISAGYYLLMRFAPEADKVANEFPIFVQLLVVILIVLVGIGVAVFWSIQRLTKESVEKDLRKQFSEIRRKLAISNGLTCYQVGQNELAIVRTNEALKENLTEIDEILAKNNLAYYYALKHESQALSETEMEKAKAWAKFVLGKYDRWSEGYNKLTWVETYTFTMSRLTKGRQESEKIIQELSDMLKRPEIDEIKSDVEANLKYLEARLREEMA